MSVREALIFLNLFAIGVILAIIAYRVLSVRRNPDRAEPQNLTPFAEDATLETTRLERVLRWALICSTVLAVGLPLYWILEPSRQEAEEKGFEHRAEERGATLYANDQMEAYDSAKSLACATCHGVEGEGGSAPFTLPASQTGTGRPVQVIWKAPALNTVLSRFTPDQVTQILNYGRPGTPMAAWGVEGGGPKGEQAISDIVAYLDSIQLGDDGAQQQVLDNIKALAGRRRRWRRRRRPTISPSPGRPRGGDDRRRGLTATNAVAAARAGSHQQSELARHRLEREPGRAAVRRELRALPHQGLVVPRSVGRERPLPGTRGEWCVRTVASSTARPSSSSPARPASSSRSPG